MGSTYEARTPRGNCVGCGHMPGRAHNDNCPAPKERWFDDGGGAKTYSDQSGDQWVAATEVCVDVYVNVHNSCDCDYGGELHKVRLPYPLVAELLRRAGWTVEPPK